MTIDAHVHFWKYDKVRDTWITGDMKTLKQDYLPEHLLPTLKRNEIDGVVAVQVGQEEVETHFMVEMAKTHSFIKGVVGWIGLAKDDIEERLTYFSQYPVIKGWRHIVQGEPDDFLLRKDFQRGVALLAPLGYTYDILIYEKQLKPALEFVSRFPEQAFMLDHCAKPAIHEKNPAGWEKGIRELAKHPNVYCKLSGLFTEAKWKQWSPAEFYPYLDVVFDAFGTDRLVFGSDWPVILLSGIYVQWKSLLEKYMETLPHEERQKVFGDNAIRFYKL